MNISKLQLYYHIEHKKANVYSEQIFRTYFRFFVDKRTNVCYYTENEQTFDCWFEKNESRGGHLKMNAKIILNKIFNNNIMLTISILIIIILSISMGIKAVYASEQIDYEKSFISIEIKAGDTLTSIASEHALSVSEYEDYITEVKQINNLEGDTIHAGCYLMVPVYNVLE